MNVRRRGFTIIELLVVLMVITILATIVVVGYGSWQTSVARAEMKSELTNASSAIKMYRNLNGDYPASLASISYTPSTSVTLVYTLRGGGLSYCMNAGSVTVSSTAHYYIDSNVGLTPTTTACS